MVTAARQAYWTLSGKLLNSFSAESTKQGASCASRPWATQHDPHRIYETVFDWALRGEAIYRDLALADVAADYEAAMRTFPVR
jgi:hypothetical protein